MARNARGCVGIIIDLSFLGIQGDVTKSLSCGDRTCGDIAIKGFQRNGVAFSICRRNNILRVDAVASLDVDGTIGCFDARQFNRILFRNVDQPGAGHFSRQFCNIRAQGDVGGADAICSRGIESAANDMVCRRGSIGSARDGASRCFQSDCASLRGVADSLVQDDILGGFDKDIVLCRNTRDRLGQIARVDGDFINGQGFVTVAVDEIGATVFGLGSDALDLRFDGRFLRTDAIFGDGNQVFRNKPGGISGSGSGIDDNGAFLRVENDVLGARGSSIQRNVILGGHFNDSIFALCGDVPKPDVCTGFQIDVALSKCTHINIISLDAKSLGCRADHVVLCSCLIGNIRQDNTGISGNRALLYFFRQIGQFRFFRIQESRITIQHLLVRVHVCIGSDQILFEAIYLASSSIYCI